MVSSGSLSSFLALRNSADSLRLGFSSLSLVLGAENPSEYPHFVPNSRDVHNSPFSPIRDPIEHHFLRSLPHYFSDKNDLRSSNFQLKMKKKYLHFSVFSEKNVHTFKIPKRELDKERIRSFESLLRATNEGTLNLVNPHFQSAPFAEKHSMLESFYKFVQKEAVNSGSALSVPFCDEILLEDVTGPRVAFPMFSSPSESVCTTRHFPVLASGACGVLLCSGTHLSELGVPAMCRLVDYAFSSKIPSKFETQVYSFMLNFLTRNQKTFDEIDFIEIHENSSVLMSVLHKFIPKHRHKVNVHGGSLATGLVQGAVGAHLVLNAATLLQTRTSGLALVFVSNEIGDFGIFLLEKSG